MTMSINKHLLFLTAFLFLQISGASAKDQVDQSTISRNSEPYFTHTITKGETLSKISALYEIPISNICKMNNIKNPDLIYAGKKLELEFTYRLVELLQPSKQHQVENDSRHLTKKKPITIEEKLVVIKEVSDRTRIPWQILAGLAKQESSFNTKAIGDGGKSHGAFQFNLKAHPKITLQQAQDFTWSANKAGDYLLECGYAENPFNALRKWNGSLKDKRSEEHAERVIKHAKNFGYGISA